jgi:cytochrome c biogenesis protein CcmG, thiol:disulfide interchange protein DsbE
MRSTLPKTFAVILAVLPVACAAPRAVKRGSPPLLGKAVDVTAVDLEGREVRVSRTGAKVAVVDFWATWCAPCREQLPFLQRLADEYRAAGVEVYAIALDEERSAVEEFLVETPVRFPVLWDEGRGKLAEGLGVTRLPTTLLLDREGVVRAVHLGFDRAAGEVLEAELRRLLEE